MEEQNTQEIIDTLDTIEPSTPIKKSTPKKNTPIEESTQIEQIAPLKEEVKEKYVVISQLITRNRGNEAISYYLNTIGLQDIGDNKPNYQVSPCGRLRGMRKPLQKGLGKHYSDTSLEDTLLEFGNNAELKNSQVDYILSMGFTTKAGQEIGWSNLSSME